MPDLTQEEFEECLAEYLDVFRNSSGSATAELICRIRLKDIGMEKDEIDYVIRTNRP